MRHLDSRKAIKELQQLCKEHGIELIVVESKGKGSHETLVFRDPNMDHGISLAIAGGREISPGVQRQLIRVVTTAYSATKLGKLVYLILKNVFDPN